MKHQKEHRYSTTARVWTIIGSSFMALLGVLCITAGVLLDWGYGLMQQDTGEDVPHQEQPAIPNEDEDDPTENPDYQQGNQEDVDSGSVLQSIPLRGNQAGVRNI